MKLKGTKFYFIGIGGIGMCGLAELLHNLGAIVQGSDLSQNTNVKALENLGIKVHQGHSKNQLSSDIDVVVYSSAIPKTNEELVAAREMKIPIIQRAEALAELMGLKRGIAIAGTHGKTTTTSLTACSFISAGSDPTIAVGGRLDLIKSTAKLGAGEWLIAEADESDGSFNRLSPEIVVITNIDNDHMDHYKTFENLQNAYYEFALRIPFYGTAILCGDDPKVRELFRDFPKRAIFYGVEQDNDFVLTGEKGSYKVLNKSGETFCNFSLAMPGTHNALNALASILVSQEAKLSLSESIAGIESFSGVDRRFQNKGKHSSGAEIFDDYAHHPTEIKAVLAAFKEKFPDKTINAIFQPHRYSRFEECWDDFLSSFANADNLFVVPVYRAGESPREGIDSQSFVNKVNHPNCEYFENNNQLISKLNDELKNSDVLVTLGAGDIVKLGESLLGDS